jgi:type VI secretion system protein ImpE
MSDVIETAEAAVKDGNPAEALKHLVAAVKAKPADARLRVFMAQLLCVLGQWERAHTQLNVAAEMLPAAIPMREMVGHALRCELLRAEVFAGKRAPMVFGHPEQWLAMLIESLLQAGQGNEAMSQDLAARAFEEAPATPGKIDGEPFEWIADADSRLGPVLEAFVNGKYYWIPFNNLARISLEVPTDLRDMVWIPAYLTFANGGEVVAYLPARYPGSQASEDGQILLSRKTEWRDIGGERFAGLGQRLWTTSTGDFPLLNARIVELEPVSTGEAPESDAPTDTAA